MTLTVIFTLGLILVWLLNTLRKVFRLPPGPWGLPIVGYLPWMTKTPTHKLFVELGKKYGGIFSVKIGSETTVVFNDWQTIRATLVDQPRLFSGRPKLLTLKVGGKEKDFSFTDGLVWKRQRNLAVQCLRSLGMGKHSLEGHFQDLANEIIQVFLQLDHQIVEMEKQFFTPILNFNWKLISSYDITTNKSELSHLETMVRNLVDSFSADNPINSFPWLRFFQPKDRGFWKYVDYNEQLWSYLRKTVNRHMADWIEGSENCFIDYYLGEIKQKQANEHDCPPPFNVEHLLGSIWDLFLAGLDTTNNTIIWGCLYLAVHPQVQLKIQQELDLVIGRQRIPQLKDFPSLPYLDAFVKEVHRYSSIIGFSLPHSPITTTQLNGYTIPKGIVCLQNIYAVHHDPDLWEEPELFKPERFLDANNRVTSPPYLMPFSIGPRQCPGQPLAEMQLRVVFGRLLHQFSLCLHPNRPRPSLEPECRMVFQAQPYSLLIESRKD